MPEPITEVWLLTFRTKQGRVERALYLDEKLATSQSHLLTGRGLGDVAVSRLPLATPEMVADKARLDWLECLLTAESRIEITHHRVDDNKDFGHFASIGKLLDIEERIGDDTYGFGPGVRAAIDAARAAGGDTP